MFVELARNGLILSMNLVELSSNNFVSACFDGLDIYRRMNDIVSTRRQRPLIYIVDSSVDITGAFICARNVARLLRDDADITIVLPNNSRIGEEYLTNFKSVVRLPIINIRKSLFSLLAYFPALLFSSWKLSRHLKRNGCERLQMNDFYLMHGALARLFGFRGTIATWVRIDPRRFGSLLSRIWLTLAYRYSDNVIAVSHYIRDILPHPEEVLPIYDPVFLRDIAKRKLNSVIHSEGRKLVFIGNYIKGKGQQHAITAFTGVADTFPDVHLHFYGSDMGRKKNHAYLERLEAQAHASGLADRIHFHGFVDDIGAVMEGAFAALNFSESESFSLSCLEASHHGLPVVATRSGGPAEIVVDGETGFLVNTGDVDAMRRAVGKLLGNEVLARNMGEKGAAYVKEKFSSVRFKREISQLYRIKSSPVIERD